MGTASAGSNFSPHPGSMTFLPPSSFAADQADFGRLSRLRSARHDMGFRVNGDIFSDIRRYGRAGNIGPVIVGGSPLPVAPTAGRRTALVRSAGSAW
jgi:hypothetical protein